MYKIIIHIPTHTDNTWFYYQEDGKDYVANTLQEIRETVLTLIDVYGEDYIKIVKQETGDDMFGSVEGFLYDDSDDYEELLNRPFINGIEVIGQLSLEQLGIQPAGDYALHDDLNRVEDKIDNIDLTPYALNSRVDSVESKIDNIDLSPYATNTKMAEVENKIDNIDLTPYATNTRVDGVESKVDAIDLTPYATMEYLDEVVAGIDFSSTNEEISGIKTFSVLPRSTVTPISEEELTNKAYVDHEVLGCATKKYVDDAVANIDIPEVEIDLTNYYNKAEVDQAIENVQLSGEVMAEMTVYSTEEQIIGSWINGKNIYRRVFTGSMTGMGATWTNIAQVFNVDEVINLSGTISNTLTDGRSLNLNTYEEEAHNACFSFCKADNNYLQARVNGWNKKEWGFVFKLYFEYTKTTDAENSSTITYYPITREYVDEAIANAITSVLGGEY